MNKNVLALGRLKKGEMNRTEAEYAAFLDAQKAAGLVHDYWFEGITFVLAPNTRYTPDFMVLNADLTIDIIEVKGFWTDDARVKIKLAASIYYLHRFVAVKKVPKRDGGGWSSETFPREK